MIEDDVKAQVAGWLKQQGYLPIREFEFADGRLDFVGWRWSADSHEIDVVGVECKGEPSPADVWRITSEQLYRYAPCVPRLYFACSVVGESLVAFESFCHAAGVGFLLAGPDGMVERREPAAIGVRLDPSAFVQQVRARLVMEDAFEAEFGADVRRGRGWIATREDVQWNATLGSEAVLGVNVENLGAFRNQLGSAIGAAPATALLTVFQDRYYAPSRRSSLPLLSASVGTVDADDVSHIVARAGALHLTIGLPLWDTGQVRRRAWYASRMAEVRAGLQPVRDALLGV